MQVLINIFIKRKKFSILILLSSMVFISCSDAITETKRHLLHGKKSLIAFYTKDPDTGKQQIYSMELDGNNKKRLTSFSDKSCFSPSWSSDGMNIVFFTSGGSTKKICVMKWDGTGVKYITEGQRASWSPDGRKLVYVETVQGKMCIAELDNPSNEKVIVNETGQIFGESWSLDGDKIVYKNGQKIKIVEIKNTSNIYELKNFSSGEPKYPTWHPDGSKILYVKKNSSTDYEIRTINADSSDDKKLISSADDDLGYIELASYSPNGSQIVFSAQPLSSGGGTMKNQIFIADADGKNIKQITDLSEGGNSPCWRGKPR